MSQPHPSVDSCALERAWCELFNIALKIPVQILCTKLMFLLDFSLHFFKVNASTKLGLFIYFLNAQYLNLGEEEKEYSQIPICIFSIWVFLALDFPPDLLCVCCRRLVLQLQHPPPPPPPPFNESFNFCDFTVRAAWPVQSCMHILYKKI